MSRFFIDGGEITAGHIILKGEDVNHIKKVLRLEKGDNIILCDGECTDYLAEIEAFENGCVFAAVKNSYKNTNEPPVSITLFQGIPKSDKMDFIVQKSVELGVSRIVPVTNERTVVRINSGKDADNKVSRWRRIALEAAKQCNRGIIPLIDYPMDFMKALEDAGKHELAIIPYEMEKETGIGAYIKKENVKNAAVMIGPEGGFTQKEAELASDSGIRPVTLGPRILRTETAGIMVLSIMMYELGDV